MSAPQPSLSTSVFFVRAALKAVAWVRQRPFMLSPLGWLGLTLGVLVLAGVTALAGPVPWWGSCALAASAGLGFFPLWAWARASRSDGRKLVFVARFADENPEHSSIATVHLREVERRLLNNPLLQRSFDFRFLKAPLKEGHAQRLLRHTPAVTVISGSGLLVDGHARWEGWVLQRWPQTTGMLEPDESGGGLVSMFSTQLSAAQRSKTRTDAEYPVRRLTTDIFSAEHAEDIEGVLLVAAAAFSHSDADEALALTEADAMGSALPLPARAVLEIGKAMRTVVQTGDSAAAARQLEAAGDGGANHIYLWNTCVAFWTRAEQQGLSEGEDRVRAAEKGLAVAPDDFYAQVGAGYGYMVLERPTDAVPHLENATYNPDVMDQQLLRQDLGTAYHLAGDLEKARHERRREYEAWPPSMRRVILKNNRMTEQEYLDDPLASADDVRGEAEDFSDAEVAAVAAAMRAVVDEDQDALRAMRAYDNDRDPYSLLREHPMHEDKRLVLPEPANDPRQWTASFQRRADGTSAVDVWMATPEDEFFPFALQLDLVPEGQGGLRPRFVELQIL